MRSEISQAQVARAIAMVDEAVLAPETLPLALERASEAMGVHSLYLIRLDGAVPEFIAPPKQIEPFLKYQAEGWWQVDDRTSRCGSAALREGGIIRDQNAVPEDVRRTSAIYNEFYRPQGINWCAGWTVKLEGETWVWALQRDAASGPVSDGEAAILARAASAFNRAALMATRLRNMRAKGAAEGLSAAGFPAIVLDHLGGAMLATPSAVDLFDASFGVRLGRLWAANAKARSDLERLSALAARRIDNGAPATIVIDRGEDRRPLLALPLPVRGVGLDALPGARLILMLIDLESRPQPATVILRAAFGLTPTEAHVAQRMAAGTTLQAIAEAMSLRLATVRHMTKAIFAKLHVHRQAELVVLLAKFPLDGKVRPRAKTAKDARDV